MFNSKAHKQLTAAKNELDKITLMEKAEGWNKEKYRDRRIAAEKAFLDARLASLDESISEFETTKTDLIRAFNQKYPHFKEQEAAHATT